MLNNIVFVATGDAYNKQCVFAILTLINVYDKKIPADIGIVVYTDNWVEYEFLKEYVTIKTVAINQDTITNWLGNKTFMLKIKLQVVLDFISNNKGNMLFVDTDVVFKKKPDSIFREITNGNFFMHVYEGKTGAKVMGLDGPPKESYFDRSFEIGAGKKVEISRESEMWNSGVIGLPENTAALITQALELCDQLLDIKLHHTTEQLSFSVMLSGEKKLKSAADSIFHYWPRDYKNQMNQFINKLLSNKDTFDIDKTLDSIKHQKVLRMTTMAKIEHNLHPGNLRKFLTKKLPRFINKK